MVAEVNYHLLTKAKHEVINDIPDHYSQVYPHTHNNELTSNTVEKIE